MINKQKISKRIFFFLIIFLFSISFLSLKSLKNVDVQNIKIYGSKLFTEKDIVDNSSLDIPTRLVFVKTKFIEKELKQNLSLKNISVRRQILPFGLRILIQTRTPVAYGERVLNSEKISGFIDEDGFFIYKQHAEKETLESSSIEVFGWQEKSIKPLSEILTAHKNSEIDIIKIRFSPNGFLTLEEKDLNLILLGFNHTLVRSQLQIISKLKDYLSKNNLSEKIDNIDLTDPSSPKIKVFKP